MTDEPLTRRCPACGGIMHRAVTNETVTFQGHSLRYEQPGWQCQTCDEGVLEGEDNAFHDAALHEVMARAKGSPISPLTIRAAREAVGLSHEKPGACSAAARPPSTNTKPRRRYLRKAWRTCRGSPYSGPTCSVSRGSVSDSNAVASDIALIRRAGLTEPLGSIIRRVYPEGAGSP